MDAHAPNEPTLPTPAQKEPQGREEHLGAGSISSMRNSPDAEQPASVQSAQSMPTAAAQCPPQPTAHCAPKEDAFAHLMRQQRERSQTWTFYLGARPDGGLFWHIWRDHKGAGVASALTSVSCTALTCLILCIKA